MSLRLNLTLASLILGGGRVLQKNEMTHLTLGVLTEFAGLVVGSQGNLLTVI